jgi:hypothetical protein
MRLPLLALLLTVAGCSAASVRPRFYCSHKAMLPQLVTRGMTDTVLVTNETVCVRWSRVPTGTEVES